MDMGSTKGWSILLVYSRVKLVIEDPMVITIRHIVASVIQNATYVR